MFSSQQFGNYHKSAAKNAFLHISSEFLHKMFAHFMINLLCAFNCHTHTTLTHTHSQTATQQFLNKTFAHLKCRNWLVLAFFEWKFEFEFETRTFYANFACLLTFIAGGGVSEIRGSATQLTIHSRGVAHTHTREKRLKPKPEQKIFN